MIATDTAGGEGVNPSKPAAMAKVDYDFLMSKKADGVSFVDAKAALVKAKQGHLAKTSPNVAAIMDFASDIKKSAQAGELEGGMQLTGKEADIKEFLLFKGLSDEDAEARIEMDRGPSGEPNKGFFEKVGDVPSIAMEAAEKGEAQKIDIKQRQAALEAKDQDLVSKLDKMYAESEDLPVPDRIAAWFATGSGRLLNMINNMGVEALPYTQPLKEAIYEQFVDPAISSLLEADVVPTGKPGDWVQSLADIGRDIKSVTPEPVKEGLGEVATDVGQFIQENPGLALELEKTGATMDLARPILDALIGYGALKKAPEALGNIIKEATATGEALTPVVSNVKTTLTPVIEKITKPRLTPARNDLAESMINSMIKVDPARGAEHFYKLSKGQTMGNFLLERDIIGTPDQTVEMLATRFNKVKNTFDETVASIEGTYKFAPADDILEEMAERFAKTLDKKNLKRVNQLTAKYNAKGLTMAENLELKRLYESKVKTGYLKDNNSELVDRATNLDNELREAFVAEAKKGGFENVQELSREIQLTKGAMDSIESKTIRRLVNNQFSLTDNLLLVGGAINPSSLAVLGVKKIASSPSIQAKMIRALATNDIKIMKEIPGIPTEIIATKNAAKRQLLYEQWLESSGLKGVIEDTELLKLTEGKAIQAPPAEDIVGVRGQQYQEGTGVFEGQRSVNASTTPKNIINNSSTSKTVPKNKDKVNVPFKKGETPTQLEAKKYKTAEEFVKAQDSKFYHGTPTGEFGSAEVHVGTKQAATEALEARIGIPADGKGWQGKSNYGDTLLAGKKSIASGKFGKYRGTGFNVKIPENDFYLKDHPELAKNAAFGDGTQIPLDVKPSVFSVKIKGEMTNSGNTPLSDTKANATIRGQLKKGNAKRGYYYENVGEDAGSISAVVPSKSHLEKGLTKSQLTDIWEKANPQK